MLSDKNKEQFHKSIVSEARVYFLITQLSDAQTLPGLKFFNSTDRIFLLTPETESEHENVVG